MIFPGVLGALLTLLVAGFGLTLLLLRGRAQINLLEAAALAWLFGSGAISLFLWGGGLIAKGAPLQLGITALAVFFAAYGAIEARRWQVKFYFPKPRHPIEWILAGAIALEGAIIFFSAGSHGLGWDGLLNWEVKARYAFLNDGVIPAAYYHSASRAYTHPGYPLLIPLTELWFYRWMGEINQFFIKLIFPLYYAAGAILLATAGTRLTNRRWPGLAASALLFFVPALTSAPGDAAGGYADFPLGVLYLCSFAYLLLFSKSGAAFDLRVFAIATALLPWAKREGAILWFVAVLCGAAILWRRREKLPAYLWLLPGLFVILAWKLFLHFMHPAEGVEFLPLSLATVSGNLPRLGPIFRMALGEMLETTRWSLFWPGLTIAFLYLAVGMRDRRFFILAFAVGTPLVVYSAAYLLSAWPDYSLHLGASFSRLLLHVMPVGWLAIALAVSGSAAASPPPDNPDQSQNR